MGFRAEEVKPEKWDKIEVLFDNGWYSVIVGTYSNAPGVVSRDIGERWNGDEDGPGYPNQGKYPLWYCRPLFLEIPTLHGLLDELATHPEQQSAEGAMNADQTADARRGKILAELRRLLKP